MLDPNVEMIYETVKVIGIVGGGAVIFTRLGRMAGKFEQIGVQQAAEIADLAMEMKTMRSVVTDIAVQKAEMGSMQNQISLLMSWYDELRHGKGIIRDD
jgi:hypothetical protein